MYVPHDYLTATILMFVTMVCWGSWANTQKLTQHGRFELFYWDYTIGLVLGSLILGFTLGNQHSGEGLMLLADFNQARLDAFWDAFGSGVLFNLANVFLVAGIALVGMAVAFPVAIGMALIIGTLLSYMVQPSGNALLLFAGVFSVLIAVLLDARAYKALSHASKGSKGMLLPIVSGLLMGLFYPLIARSMSGVQALGPYAALIVFCVGVLLGNIPLNALLMRKPLEGTPLRGSHYWHLSFADHLCGIFGGLIWVLGMGFNLIAAKHTGPAIAYAFGQGATLVAAFWGVFIWKEFKGHPEVNRLLALMFVAYLIGLVLIGASSN
ncbi:MAG: GRP family sugar transporter [Pseudomonadota bacterium]